MRLAILDDYQGIALRQVDWASVPGVTVVPFRDHVADEARLADRLAGFQAVMRIRERTPLTRRVVEACPDLKLILATGMRNAGSIDLAACDERGTTVCATDALHQTTVEVTWLLILSLMRNATAETASLRAGGWQLGLGRGLAGRTLGIVGFGNMGRPVARIAAGFGMKVIAWSPNLTPERTDPHGVECVSKAALLERSDVVTIHIPLVPETRGLVGEAELQRMRPGAVIVNTSRPQILDERALVSALETGRIAGAGLDVFETEPLPADHPFRRLPNVVATPHVGFVTQENYAIFFAQSLENLAAYRAGRPIRTISAARPFLPDSQVAMQMHSGSAFG